MHKAFSAIAKHHGDNGWAKSDQLLSLVEIENESNGFYFASAYPNAAYGYGLFFDALVNKNLSKLPRDAQKTVLYIAKLSQSKQFSVEFKSDSVVDKTAVVRQGDTFILPEEKPLLLRSQKTFYGSIERVGGATPGIRFKTFAGNNLTAETTESIAQKAAKLLYKPVKMGAFVTWEYGSKTEKYKKIHIIDVLPHQVKKNTDLFTTLREGLGEF